MRPFGTKSRFRLDGGLDYLWFARTASQRKLNWYGSASLELEGVKTSLRDRGELRGLVLAAELRGRHAGAAGDGGDDRAPHAAAGRSLESRPRRGPAETPTTEDQEYLGTNLGRHPDGEASTTSRGRSAAALSIKTSLVGGGEQSWYRFPRLPERDGQSTLAYGGLRTDATALVSGQALGGYRWFRLEQGLGRDRGIVYADVNATWNVSPKTKLGAIFVRDLDYSAFATTARRQRS